METKALQERPRSSEPSVEEGIQTCLVSSRMCQETMAYCLVKGGAYSEASFILELQDCAKVCSTTAELMISRSPLYQHMTNACAEVTRQCAEDCRELGQDSTLERCAEQCLKSEQVCRAFSKAELTQ